MPEETSARTADTTETSAKNPVTEMIGHLYPRYVVAGLDFNDLNRLLPSVKTWEDWRLAAKGFADERKELAEEAQRAGHHVTAGEAFVAASMYYHFSQIGYFEDLDRKLEMARLSREAHARAFDLVDPPIEQLKVPFRGIEMVGNLRVPPGPKPPVMILLPGADSSKEEMFTFENLFLARGLATLSFEGPGQGATREQMGMIDDYEHAISALVDFIETLPQVDADRIGIYGRSLGGYLAPRAAAFEPRLKAVVSAGGIYDLSYWDKFPPGVMHNFRHAWGAKDFDEAAERAANLSLQGIVERVACPFLIVHSGQDEFFPASAAKRMAAEAKSDAKLVIYPEGAHVCDNIPYKYRPLVADWSSDTLSGVRA